jgi:hypothetical protein
MKFNVFKTPEEKPPETGKDGYDTLPPKKQRLKDEL